MTNVNRAADYFSIAFLWSAARGYVQEVVFSLLQAVKRWQHDDGSTLAAAVAYYLALSVFPMWLLLTAGIGIVLRYTRMGRDAEDQIFSVVAEHCSPALEAQVRGLVIQLQDQSVVSGPVGLLTAIMAAIGVFHQFERGFDKIWRVPKPISRGVLATIIHVLTRRLVAFMLLAGVGLTIVAILVANVVISYFRQWMANFNMPGTVMITIVDATATILLNALAFGMLYRWLPKRPVLWSHAIRGGLLAAIIWEIGRQLLGLMLVRMSYTTAYGAAGSLIVLLLWFYWGVTILFFGAEYVQVLTFSGTPPLSMFRTKPMHGHNAAEVNASDGDEL
ncbi:MAG: YihY/virulence factor BrkB family protein [Planctomycetales bacterium]|nr:YihY/virulence factor BrkB family protein [Planctomycetales bacterium]